MRRVCAKKTLLRWVMGFVGDNAHAQRKRSFCGAFFKKRLLASLL
jgi:hypothetical protein